MKKILIFQWFDSTDALRKSELIDCIEHNLRLGFDNVIIFNDSVKPTFTGDNVTNIEISGRLTYRNFIDVVREPRNFGAMICLTNTDIKLDKKIFELSPVLHPNLLISITRYETDGQLTDMPWCTQDTWVALSQPIPQSVLLQSDIPLGLPGCENRIAEIFFSAGFRVSNPCLDIKNVHVQTDKRPLNDENRLFGAYLFVPACTISDIGKTEFSPRPVYVPRHARHAFRIGV
jgi:hypothetical protein